MFYGRERNSLKTNEQVTLLVYLRVILFRMHERDTATELELRNVLQMTLEHVLTQRFNQSTKWAAKETYLSKYVKMQQTQENPLEQCFCLEFFICHETLKFL